MIPEAVALYVDLEETDLGRAAQRAFAVFADAGLAQPLEWSIPLGGRARKKGLTAALAELAGTPRARSPETSISVLLADGFDLSITRARRVSQAPPPDDLRALMLARSIDADHPLPSVMRSLAEVATRLLRALPIREARTRWHGGGARCLPEVPIAGTREQLVIASPAAAAAAYDAPDVFFGAWDARIDEGDRSLFVRAIDAENSQDLLGRIIDPAWAMARAAKPRLARYYEPIVLPEEEPVYLAGESPLQTVGYLPDQRLVELSCVLPPGAHIPGWQIHTLFQRLDRKQLPDGRPVDVVRVVFLERAAAEQEKRPLLDIGVEVYWQHPSGDLAAITD